MFKNRQNCVPEPVSILGSGSDSLATLDEKEVTFTPLTSFYFSEHRVTSIPVSNKISPLPTPYLSPPEISDPAPSTFDRFLTNLFQVEAANWKYNLEPDQPIELKFKWLPQDLLALE